MTLKVFVDENNYELKNMYIAAANNHNNKILNSPSFIDAGFDLFAPGNTNDDNSDLQFFGTGWRGIGVGPVNKLDFKICCSAQMITDKGKTFNTGYYMYPRSSLSKTNLRLANATGIIDAGYRGHLMGMFDVVNVEQYNTSTRQEQDYLGQKYDRYLQICAPGLVPILVEIVDTKEELSEQTERADGGFGSTGR
jgi:hypothetical protein